jgi:hypothetical protein
MLLMLLSCSSVNTLCCAAGRRQSSQELQHAPSGEFEHALSTPGQLRIHYAADNDRSAFLAAEPGFSTASSGSSCGAPALYASMSKHYSQAMDAAAENQQETGPWSNKSAEEGGVTSFAARPQAQRSGTEGMRTHISSK